MNPFELYRARMCPVERACRGGCSKTSELKT